MDPNNMTGESDQRNPPSVFGFDPYPPPLGVNWNQTNPFVNPLNPSTSNQICVQNQIPFANFPSSTASMSQHQIVAPSTSRYVPGIVTPAVQPFGDPLYPEPLTSYSFGGSKPSQDVVQFPFECTSPGFGQNEYRCKRKTNSPPLQPVKQHITEEKMAEHMSKLHISSETPSLTETETTKMRRLYLCEEMRKLQTDSIIPKSLLEKIERPCTALVLWKPPATRWIPSLSHNEVIDENENNNSENASESNMVDMVDAVVNTMDMDNC